MLTLTPSLPALSLAALMPTLELVRRHARDRRHLMQHGSGFYDETVQRNYTASETSLTLLLEYVLAPMLDQLDDAVNATEQLQLAVRVLDTLIQAATPQDQAVPQMSVAQGRRCLMPQRDATLLVQVTLAVIQAALLNDALFLVVWMPRQAEGEVIVEVEADTTEIAGDEEARCFQQQLAANLTAVGGSIQTQVKPEGSSLVTIRLPLATLTLKAA
jgi:hypothetical protein